MKFNLTFESYSQLAICALFYQTEWKHVTRQVAISPADVRCLSKWVSKNKLPQSLHFKWHVLDSWRSCCKTFFISETHFLH